MTNYTARVEIHGADEDEYEALHDAMEAEGFVRWIEDQSGERLRLPTAEYNLPGSALDRRQVAKRAERAAKSVKPDPRPWILVTESAGRTWSGLHPWRE